jgi:DNA-binding ferritin-like protein (Dps family)
MKTIDREKRIMTDIIELMEEAIPQGTSRKLAAQKDIAELSNEMESASLLGAFVERLSDYAKLRMLEIIADKLKE